MKFFNFKKRGNAIVTTTVEEKTTNILKANERISELRQENQALKDNFGVETEVVTTAPNYGATTAQERKDTDAALKRSTEFIKEATAFNENFARQLRQEKKEVSRQAHINGSKVRENFPAQIPASSVTLVEMARPRTINVPRYRIVGHEYEIALEKGNGFNRVYIRSLGLNGFQHNNAGWSVLGWNPKGDGRNHSNGANGEPRPDVTRDLSAGEFDAIIDAKPSMAALRSQYRFTNNTTTTLTWNDPVLLW